MTGGGGGGAGAGVGLGVAVGLGVDRLAALLVVTEPNEFVAEEVPFAFELDRCLAGLGLVEDKGAPEEMGVPHSMQTFADSLFMYWHALHEMDI